MSSSLTASPEDRIEQHPERPERLAAPLGAEAEQDHVTLTQTHIEGGSLPLQELLAQ